MPRTPLLVSIPYSPWSRMARTALDRMGVRYEKKLYTPTLSEPWLRVQLRRARGPVTVPVLLWEGEPITDSWEIVRWANDRSETKLIPDDQLPAVERWHHRAADEALPAGRLRTTTHVLSSHRALQASLPPFMSALGPLGKVVGQDAAKRLLTKYGDGGNLGTWEQTLADYCAELEAELDGRDHLLDEPSYADIAAAYGLAFILPDARAKVPDAAKEMWTVPELVERHPALFAWRDRVLAG